MVTLHFSERREFVVAEIATPERVLMVIKQELYESGVEEEVSGEVSLSDLDIDSLSSHEIASRLEETFGVRVTLQQMRGSTIDDLVAVIVDAAQQDVAAPGAG